ncbi:MAG: DUF2461 domain-containing protein [Acidobacteria bacterium]|nr:DUF2461 domain-containing protein [Acidobacteriota bacterium]MBU4307037.1 DUF2461 domain-containing protein [Acidobacteriota bacterium]MBU4405777.1 DUF2461 domain-containing protein [Acidobacteriota bacterium]MCG2810242.1 DUF2461 domain-containing protein [Candidatus Aminicenantes bacterium]
MATVETFSGFPEKTVSFLRDLAANNNREWFKARRTEYETAVLEPAKAFVRAMGERLRRLSPGIKAEPRTDGSLFRLFRDTRFSPDKSPYKTNLGIYFWEGRGSRLECSGYYFHLEPPTLMLGAGLYIFPRPLLERYRRAVADPDYGAELVDIVKKITARRGYTLGGEHYKRVPAGFDVAPESAGLLRHAGLYAAVRRPYPSNCTLRPWSTTAGKSSSPWSRCSAGSPP